MMKKSWTNTVYSGRACRRHGQKTSHHLGSATFLENSASDILNLFWPVKIGIKSNFTLQNYLFLSKYQHMTILNRQILLSNSVNLTTVF